MRVLAFPDESVFPNLVWSMYPQSPNRWALIAQVFPRLNMTRRFFLSFLRMQELTTRDSYLATRFTKLSGSGHDLTPMTSEEVKDDMCDLPETRLRALQEQQENGNEEINNQFIMLRKEKGLYACIIGGLPLFTSGCRLEPREGDSCERYITRNRSARVCESAIHDCSALSLVPSKMRRRKIGTPSCILAHATGLCLFSEEGELAGGQVVVLEYLKCGMMLHAFLVYFSHHEKLFVGFSNISYRGKTI
ncbi:unnamed protein product [Choristocarpus tenellus]